MLISCYDNDYMSDDSRLFDHEIKEFIRLFDNDSLRAVRAVHAYAHTKRQQPAQKASASAGPVVVDLQDVKKTYKIGRERIAALDGVSLQIRQGEFVALTGTSGSGKSTLLQMIGGLDKPSEGIVMVDGFDLKKMRDGKLSKFRNQTIGFVFQFFYLQPFLRIRTNLEVPGMFARTKRSVRRNDIQRLAQAVGLDDRLGHLPRELSGGQMQRAAIARALLNQPKILLADEPTGNLDSVNSDAIINLFESIRRDFGTTIVIVTHDAAIAARADREIRLKDGVVI
ncbi:MAG: macrolide export ATP-binding/permease, putative transport system ATP-binding protein [Candidatus Saccharibacteria bacterium]|jgi:ABC-type lipoprotein export system ATPase subunit|nr:macrolide export ATP-binding/permease, putative transport system ATP-binding protein [Candidatus Saccharibacteria bacterium]